MTDEQRKAYIGGLIEERDSCERRGLGDRVKAIDAELDRLGARPAPPAKRSQKAKPKARTNF